MGVIKKLFDGVKDAFTDTVDIPDEPLYSEDGPIKKNSFNYKAEKDKKDGKNIQTGKDSKNAYSYPCNTYQKPVQQVNKDQRAKPSPVYYSVKKGEFESNVKTDEQPKEDVKAESPESYSQSPGKTPEKNETVNVTTPVHQSYGTAPSFRRHAQATESFYKYDNYFIDYGMTLNSRELTDSEEEVLFNYEELFSMFSDVKAKLSQAKRIEITFALVPKYFDDEKMLEELKKLIHQYKDKVYTIMYINEINISKAMSIGVDEVQILKPEE